MPLVWDVSPSTRLVKLAIYFAGLLTYDEQVLWHLIREHPALWRGKRDAKGEYGYLFEKSRVMREQAAKGEEYTTEKTLEDRFRFDLLEEHFETFEKVAKGELDKKALDKIKPST